MKLIIRMRRLLGLAICTAACAAPSRAPVAWAHLPLPLRVMTYNIRSGNGDLERTAATIRQFAPDIVGLQEVDVHWSGRSNYVDQAQELGKLLGMQVRFAPIYTLPATDSSKQPRQFGVALLSKYPIVDYRNDTLTRLSTQVQNPVPAPMPGLLEAIIDARGLRIRVFNTHLDYRSDPRVRETQVREMLSFIERNDTIPTIVFGDMNATPESNELQPLLRRLGDAWQGGRGPGFTYPADAPTKRIDYVLFRMSNIVLGPAIVPETQASDHRPVVVDFAGERIPR